MPQLGGAVGQTPDHLPRRLRVLAGQRTELAAFDAGRQQSSHHKDPAVMHRTTTDPVSPPPRACRSPTPRKAATAAAMVPAVGAIALAV